MYTNFYRIDVINTTEEDSQFYAFLLSCYSELFIIECIHYRSTFHVVIHYRKLDFSMTRSEPSTNFLLQKPATADQRVQTIHKQL